MEVAGSYKLGEIEGKQVITKDNVVMDAEQCFRELVNTEDVSTFLIQELSKYTDIEEVLNRYVSNRVNK